MLSDHDSSAAPHTAQIASPVCGTKNFSSVRLYSAPQLHRTIVIIPGICAWDRGFAIATANKNMAPHLGGLPVMLAAILTLTPIQVTKRSTFVKGQCSLRSSAAVNGNYKMGSGFVCVG